MDNYKEIEYDRVWFTSDEHYGSDRHITFSEDIHLIVILKNIIK